MDVRKSNNGACPALLPGGWRGLAVLLVAALSSAPALAAQVRLAWDASASTSVTGYYVYYGTSPGTLPSRVNAGNATTYTVTNLPAGQVHYFAVTAYSPTAESPRSNEVPGTPALLATSTVLASLSNPSSAGAPVALSASVTGVAPTGSVSFGDSGVAIAGCSSVALTGSGNTRQATCSTSALPAGTRSLVATYGGDSSNAPSTSAALAQVVKFATTTSIASSPNPSGIGSLVTFTATVSGSGPSGSVAFADGAVPIAGCTAVPLTGTGNARAAACQTASLAPGTRSVSATFAGSATHSASSNALLQYVHASATPGTFGDVPPNHPAYAAIEAVAYQGISSGCATSPRLFCPDANVSRTQMAVFIERALRGLNFVYSPTGTLFADVPLSLWAAGPIEQLYQDGITSGCTSVPLRYCPDDDVGRDGMAKFLLKARQGAAYNPPAATGTMFVDVPPTHPFAAWIEEFRRLGYTGGCSANAYCPDDPVSRAQMAVFLQRVFELIGPP